MNTRITKKLIAIVPVWMLLWGCNIPQKFTKTENRTVPTAYGNSSDSSNSAVGKWADYFADPYLVSLIDTAIKSNQELNITLQEIEISRNEIRARKGEYLPFVGIKGGAGYDKGGDYTWKEAVTKNIEGTTNRNALESNSDFQLSLAASWEVDIWHKLRNAKKSAVAKYLSTKEGKNFMVTNLIAEIANSYYELLALDKQLDILKKNIDIQTNALRIVRLQKEAARTTELAVKRFEAQVLSTQSLQYGVQQKITETENKINFLLGRFPQPVARSTDDFDNVTLQSIASGIPSQLLQNRPDIRQAEQDLVAAKLDVQVAKAKFYPSLALSASVGYGAFNPAYLLKTPESILYSLAGDLMAPLVNRNAIKAAYATANAKQIQMVYNYERVILNGYVEVVNQLSNINNLDSSYNLKSKQVQALTQSINISNDLFRSARADYMEVLLTQRDALESKFELIDMRKQQLNARVNIYHALGGGWK